MSILMSVGTVFFGIICVLLIIVILLQSDKSAGMGVLGGASSGSAFGSSTADVITKITSVMVAIFMIGSLGLAILESKRVGDIEKELLSPESKATGILEQQKEQPADKDTNSTEK